LKKFKQKSLAPPNLLADTLTVSLRMIDTTVFLVGNIERNNTTCTVQTAEEYAIQAFSRLYSRIANWCISLPNSRKLPDLKVGWLEYVS